MPFSMIAVTVMIVVRVYYVVFLPCLCSLTGGDHLIPACLKILLRVPFGTSLLPCRGTGKVAPVRGENHWSCLLPFPMQ